MRCPDCGSSTRLKVIKVEYYEDGWEIEVVRTYKCVCGCLFTGTAFYQCQDGYVIVEKLPKSS